ncbi:MAG: O-antigen ligase family protein [bacterium]|nr:O-antigen ligase family protein [bacterium]
MSELANNSLSALKPVSVGRVYISLVGLTLLLLTTSIIYLLVIGETFIALTAFAFFCATLLVFYPQLCFYLFFYLLAAYIPRTIGTFDIHPYDLAMGLLAVSVALDFLLHKSHLMRRGFFDGYFMFIIAITFVSALFAYSPARSIVPCARILIIYLAFRVFLTMALKIGVERLLHRYVYLVFFLSLINIGLYLYHGGEQRIFGTAWLAYETYAMTALPMALTFLVFHSKPSKRLIFGAICIVIGIGIFATQSRAPLLAVLTAIPVVLIMAGYKARQDRLKPVRRRLKTLLVPLLVLATILILFRESVLSGAIGRYEQFIDSLSDPQGTVALRLVLWTAAWKAFLSDPLTGIGIGNFRLLVELMPRLRLVSVWDRISYMSAHNVFLQYLAETGIVGGIALISLAMAGLRKSWSNVKTRLAVSDQSVSVALYVCMFLFATTIFYMREWTWGQGGYLMAFFFALTTAWTYELRGKKLNTATEPSATTRVRPNTHD